MLALVGWSALNSAAAILFYGVAPAQAALIALNTALSAAAAGTTAALITRTRFTKPDASLTANGWIGGLAAVSAGCAFVSPLGAVAIGIVAGALVTFSVEWFELRMRIDDPGGSVSSHAVGGLWGVLSVALFMHLQGGAAGQWLAQVLGIATLFGFVFPLTYGLNLLLNYFHRQRVAAEGEHQGMDLFELGAGAYPEFITHSDEFTQRKI